jgi:hypothetical protein
MRTLNMKIINLLTGLAAGIGLIAMAGAGARAAGDGKHAVHETKASSKYVSPAERWSLFRGHMEELGKGDLLPEEDPEGKPPASDAILGIIFRISPDIAAADDLLGREPPDVEGARKRLEKLKGEEDPYISDYAKLLNARCDLLEKKFRESARRFEEVIESSRNLAIVKARRGLAGSYRGLDETSMEILELRFLLADLPLEKTADRSWAESRLAEIRRDHDGPLHDSGDKMEKASTRLARADPPEKVSGDQEKVEDILDKIARLLEEVCPICQRRYCECPG